MAEQTVPIETGTQITEAKPIATREEERYLRPPVDIYETSDGLVVVADLPCVDKDGIDVRVDNGVLTIEGRANYTPVHDAYYSEFSVINFFRQFQLDEEIDQERISAELKHGVLTIHLPKAQKAKPKQISVKVH